MPEAAPSPRQVVARVWRRLAHGTLLDSAAQTAFFAALALAPFLVVLSWLAAFVPRPGTVQRLLGRAGAMMPDDAYRLVHQVVDDVQSGRSTGLFTLSVATALWSASRAANSLRKGLNASHGVEEGRSWPRQQLVSVLVTAGTAALLLGSAVVTVGGGRVLYAAARAFDVDPGGLRLWGLLRWPLAVTGVLGLTALAYRALPDTRPRAHAVWAGAATATALFVAGGVGFSFWVESFGNYGAAYGSLAGVVVLLLWLWLMSAVILVGGEVTAAFPGARPRR